MSISAVIDTETLSFYKRFDVYEIGILEFTSNKGKLKIVDVNNVYIKDNFLPYKEMPTFYKNKHTYSDYQAMLDKAIPYKYINIDFRQYARIYAYNMKFDLMKLSQVSNISETRLYCLMGMAKTRFSKMPSYRRFCFDKGYYSVNNQTGEMNPKYNMDSIVAFFKYYYNVNLHNNGIAHTAKSDIIAEFKLLEHLIRAKKGGLNKEYKPKTR